MHRKSSKLPNFFLRQGEGIKELSALTHKINKDLTSQTPDHPLWRLGLSPKEQVACLPQTGLSQGLAPPFSTLFNIIQCDSFH